MIKSFGALYQGQIDMEGVGDDGTPANARRYSNDRLIGVFRTASEVARLADELGYDVLWMAEHHFQREGYECIPNIILLATHLAGLTKRLRFGCGFNVLPAWHPLRLAEDFACADVLTGGRVIFGIGRGYHTREVETLGAPMLDSDANRALFEEQFEIIMKAFESKAFAHRGQNYHIPPPVPYRGYELEEITLVPRPVNRPVQVWQPLVSGSPRGIDFMARNDIRGVISASAETFVDRWIHAYRDAAAGYGRDLALGENIALGYRFYIAENTDKAMREAEKYFEEHAKFAAPLGMLRYSERQMSSIGSAQGQSLDERPGIEEGVRTKVWLCGPPEDFVDYLKDVQARYPGLEHVIMAAAMGMGRGVFKEQLQAFAQDVMPHFNGAGGVGD